MYLAVAELTPVGAMKQRQRTRSILLAALMCAGAAKQSQSGTAGHGTSTGSTARGLNSARTDTLPTTGLARTRVQERQSLWGTAEGSGQLTKSTPIDSQRVMKGTTISSISDTESVSRRALAA